MKNSPTIIEADVAIVGSGVAGALTASKLVKLGIKNILLIEAGPPLNRNDVVEAFKQSPRDDMVSGFPNAAWAPRPDWMEPATSPIHFLTAPVFGFDYLRVVGGTTWHWAGATPRLLPQDFALASTYGVGIDWPMDYAALEPFYSEAEQELGIAGEGDDGSWRSANFPLPKVPLSYADTMIGEGLAKLGITYGSRPSARATRPYKSRGGCVGFGTCAPICPSGAQYAAINHVEEAEKAGVRLLDNTRVDKIIAQGDVTHLEAQKPDRTPLHIKAKVFVLAANAIETPRLLLMSGNSTYPHGIGNSSGAVGKYFMEHPSIRCRLRLPNPVYPGRGPISILASSYFRDGDFRRERAGWYLGVETRIAFQKIANEALQQTNAPHALDAIIRDRALREVELTASLEQLPRAENGFTLNWQRRDSAGQPQMQFTYTLGAYEQNAIAHIHETYKRIAGVLGAEIVDISGPLPQSHLMGMTRMGRDPRTSVTDAWGRCHDHKNLFIVSSSLFPASGCVNPTLTIAALALHAATKIKEQMEDTP